MYTQYINRPYTSIKKTSSGMFIGKNRKKKQKKVLQSVKTELQCVVIFGNAPQYDMMFKMKRRKRGELRKLSIIKKETENFPLVSPHHSAFMRHIS